MGHSGWFCKYNSSFFSFVRALDDFPLLVSNQSTSSLEAALSPEFISQSYLLPCTSGGTKLVLTLWPQHKLFPIHMTLSALSCLDPYLPVGHNLDFMDLWLFYSKSLPTYFDRILYEIIYLPADFVFCHGEYEFVKENCTIRYSRDST